MGKRLERGAGVLLPISSLPSPYGIGTLGREAYHFIDQLALAGQTYWQVLPVGPTSYGDSPYQSFSTFAGNPYFIDLDMLVEENLLEPEDITRIDWGELCFDIDYQKMYENRYRILKKAYYRCDREEKERIQHFCQENEEWLSDYCLFMACKDYFGGKEWLLWEDDIRLRKEKAISYYKEFLKEKIEFWEFVQYKFDQQWKQLKKYANERNVKIIGDIPIYVAMDSADIWANTKQYQLDENLQPVDVAGCPPDAFSEYGQKWGNPLYNWDVMKEDGFVWWKKRMAAAAKRYDVIRMDHFIGVVRYYAIPADGVPADGEYRNGPGMDLIHAIDEAIGESYLIAEDLGVLVPSVKETLEKSGYPGMKVLEFAFDGKTDNEYLPHCYEKNCVVYSGTHDNETLMGYFKSLSRKNFDYLCRYVNTRDTSELPKEVIRLAYQSVADTVIIQMQDILEKDNTARMNLPSTIGKNWRWRMKQGEFDDTKIQWLKEMTVVYNRLPKSNKKKKIKFKNIKIRTATQKIRRKKEC